MSIREATGGRGLLCPITLFTARWEFEFDTGQELEEWAAAIVAAISRLSVIGLTQTDLTAEM